MEDINMTTDINNTVQEFMGGLEEDTTAVESALKIAKANYEAILKETNSPTTARLVSGYTPEETA